jgi:hypothetical protein
MSEAEPQKEVEALPPVELANGGGVLVVERGAASAWQVRRPRPVTVKLLAEATAS